MIPTLLAKLRELYFFSSWYPVMFLLESMSVVFVLWWVGYGRRGNPGNLELITRYAAVLCAGLGVTVLAAELILLFIHGGFFDHAEPQIACVAALAVRGEPVYHLAEAPLAYGVGYGPMLYIVHAAFLLVAGQSIATVMSVGVVAFACAVAIFSGWARQGTSSRSWLWAGWLVTLALLFQQAAFWARADPWLLLLACIGLWSTRGGCPCRRAWCLGLLTGLAMNFKVYGAVVLVPAVCLGVELRAVPQLARLFAGGCLGLGLPFLLNPVISLTAYLETLALVSRHPLSADQFVRALNWMALLLLPLVVVAITHPRRVQELATSRPGPLDIRSLKFVVCLLASMAVVAVFSCKRGGGEWYFLPFLPYVIGSVGVSMARTPGGATAGASRLALVARLAGVAWLATIGFIVITRHDNMLLGLARSEAGKQHRELVAMGAKWRGFKVQMAGGEQPDGRGYDLTFVRPALVFAGHPYWFDFSALMDLKFAGHPVPGRLLDRILEDQQTLWVVPAQASPFLQRSFYDGQELFPPAFRAEFARRFQVWERGEVYDIWGSGPARVQP